MHNQSASFIGTATRRDNGNTLSIWIGQNSNTGEDIVWFSVNGGRDKRVTGSNIAKFAAELNDDMNEGEAVWTELASPIALNILKTYL
jgi:hypothetical protein